MASGKEIKNRIKSIKNTKKITKAMELVAAAKMKRAVAKTLASRSNAQAIRASIAFIREHPDAESNVKKFMKQIREKKMWDDDGEAEIKKVIEECRATFLS